MRRLAVLSIAGMLIPVAYSMNGQPTGRFATGDGATSRTVVLACGAGATGGAAGFAALATTSPSRAITFVGLSQPRPKPSRFERSTGYYKRNGRFIPLKVLVGIAQGATVEVRLLGSQLRNAALLFDPPPASTHAPLFRLKRGSSRVIFQGCADRITGFPGYFLVDGPRCVHLEVRLGHRAQHVTLPFGLPSCR